jgi:segregation and condensation protein B
MEDEVLTSDRTGYSTTLAAGDVTSADESFLTGFGGASMSPARHTAPAELESPAEPSTAAPDRSESAAEKDVVAVQQILEALLFSSDAPVSLTRLSELLSCPPVQVRLHVSALNDKYTLAGLSFRIEQIARGFQMMTLPRFQPWLARLNEQRSQTRLSPAALETLSVVAYRQPIIRAGVEAIRGVACGEVLNRLRDMGLVRMVGRAEIVGRPILWGTTRKFLDVFGLSDLESLPPLEALTLRRSTAPGQDAVPPPEDLTPLAASA